MCPRIDGAVCQSQCVSVSRKSLKSSIVGVIPVGQPLAEIYWVEDTSLQHARGLGNIVDSWHLAFDSICIICMVLQACGHGPQFLHEADIDATLLKCDNIITETNRYFCIWIKYVDQLTCSQS